MITLDPNTNKDRERVIEINSAANRIVAVAKKSIDKAGREALDRLLSEARDIFSLYTHNYYKHIEGHSPRELAKAFTIWEIFHELVFGEGGIDKIRNELPH